MTTYKLSVLPLAALLCAVSARAELAAPVAIQDLTLVREKTAVKPAADGSMELDQVFESAGLVPGDNGVLDDGDIPNQTVPGTYPAQYNSSSYPAQYNSSSYPAQYNSTSYPAQYNSTSYPAQYNSTSYPAQYNSTSYPAQYNSTSYPAQYTAGNAPSAYDTGRGVEAERYRNLPLPHLAD
jgi:anaerobic selenocysteine-containing dehydrogenase